MGGFLRVVGLHVWDVPHALAKECVLRIEGPEIRWILTLGITAGGPRLRALAGGVPLPGIYLLHPNWIEVELVLIALR